MEAATEHMAAAIASVLSRAKHIMDGANSFQCPNPQRNEPIAYIRTRQTPSDLFYPSSLIWQMHARTHTRRAC